MTVMNIQQFSPCKIIRIVTDTEAFNVLIIITTAEYKAEIVKHLLTHTMLLDTEYLDIQST